MCIAGFPVGGNLLGGASTMIYLKELVVGYQGQGLMQPISGRFLPGSLTAIMGENGAGKSTLLKTVCGLQPPVSGSVLFQGTSLNEMSWLPQQADIDRSFPIRVFDVVSMGCWPERAMLSALRHEDVERVHAALNKVGISHLASFSVDQLSGGQFQRMLFARMLVQDSPVMLMDEPFTGIDSKTQETLIQLIGELHQQGKTIITVLHNSEMVSTFFPQTLVVNCHCSHWGETQDVLSRCQLFTQRPEIGLRFG